jgi:hypothetical protein
MAAIMIDYATLCRAIEDWKSGVQPSAVTPAAPRRIAAPAAGEKRRPSSTPRCTTPTTCPPSSPGPDPTVVYQLSEYEEGDVDADEVDVADDER